MPSILHHHSQIENDEVRSEDLIERPASPLNDVNDIELHPARSDERDHRHNADNPPHGTGSSNPKENLRDGKDEKDQLVREIVARMNVPT